MSDYISLGSTPCDESCAQVGSTTYHTRMKIESKVYINQLWRLIFKHLGIDPQIPAALEGFHEQHKSFSLKNKSFPHDFGSYHEVCAFYQHDPSSQELALWLDSNLPSHWDQKARADLGEAYFQEYDCVENDSDVVLLPDPN
jgi:hypothetical protein